MTSGLPRCLAFVVLLLALAPPASPQTLRQVSSVRLPEGVTARDIRWASPHEVYVSLGRSGVVRMRTTAAGSPVAIMPPADKGGFPIAGRFGVGRNHVIVASGMGSYGWIPLSGPTRKVEDRALLAVMDVDSSGDVVGILGADRGPLQGLARDGAIAWIGTFSKGLSDLRPIMRGRSKPGGKDMARCAVLETGAIRFMKDQTLLVAPGSEPGVYRYAADGRLLQTWPTDDLGIVDDCLLSEEQMALLARDFPERMKWYASRVILDELLPFDDGPGLVLRSVEAGVTRWELVRLPDRGKPLRIALPVTVSNPRGHLRGDVRGSEIALLLFEDPLPGQKAAEPPRVVVLSMSAK